MAAWKFEGLDDYIATIEKLKKSSESSAKKALYAGADVVADALSEAIKTIPVDDRQYVPEGEMRTGIRTLQKLGLQESFGITKMQMDGYTIDVKLGFDGYNRIISDRWPQGQPNVMVARSVESGTSYMNKYPFISRTVRAKKGECESKMKMVFEMDIEAISKE